jgi:hypothetical protein
MGGSMKLEDPPRRVKSLIFGEAGDIELRSRVQLEYDLDPKPPTCGGGEKWTVPKLDDVLLNSRLSPVSHADFKAFLVTQFADENLDFITAVYQFKENVQRTLGRLGPTDTAEEDIQTHLAQATRLVDHFIRHSGMQEVNISAGQYSTFIREFEGMQARLTKEQTTDKPIEVPAKADIRLDIESDMSAPPEPTGLAAAHTPTSPPDESGMGEASR